MSKSRKTHSVTRVCIAKILLEKDSTGQYIGAGPFTANANTIWSLPVVPTNAMTAGTFLVGAFGIAVQIFDRTEANVQISTEDDQNFRKNLATMLCEERLALVVRRPQALIYGSY